MSTLTKFNIDIKLTKDNQNIPHLLFVDDCIMFCRVIKKIARNAKYILNYYCKVSSQLVNYHKSKIYFSGNITKPTKKEITDILQITIRNTIGTYRGCPYIDKRRTNADFKAVKCKILIRNLQVGRLGHYRQQVRLFLLNQTSHVYLSTL